MSSLRLPGVRTSGRHLGDLSAALVDDDLIGEERDRALAHVAGCETCRAEVHEQRQVKIMLRSVPPVEPDLALVAQLLGISTWASPGSSTSDGGPGTTAPALGASSSGALAPPATVLDRTGRGQAPSGAGRSVGPGRGAGSRGPGRDTSGGRPVGPRASAARAATAGRSRRHRAGALAIGTMSVLAAAFGSALAAGGGSAAVAPSGVRPGSGITAASVVGGFSGSTTTVPLVLPTTSIPAGASVRTVAGPSGVALVDPASVAVTVSLRP